MPTLSLPLFLVLFSLSILITARERQNTADIDFYPILKCAETFKGATRKRVRNYKSHFLDYHFAALSLSLYLFLSRECIFENRLVHIMRDWRNGPQCSGDFISCRRARRRANDDASIFHVEETAPLSLFPPTSDLRMAKKRKRGKRKRKRDGEREKERGTGEKMTFTVEELPLADRHCSPDGGNWLVEFGQEIKRVTCS